MAEFGFRGVKSTTKVEMGSGKLSVESSPDSSSGVAALEEGQGSYFHSISGLEAGVSRERVLQDAEFRNLRMGFQSQVQGAGVGL